MTNVKQISKPRRKTKNPITDVDKLAENAIVKQTTVAQDEKIREKFKWFVESDVDTIMGSDAKFRNLYKLRPKDVIIRVFHWRPDEKEINKEGKFDFEDFYKKYTSIAKVLVAGEEADYKSGDIVKLRDYDCMSVKNPKWESWQKAQMNESNMEKVGETPPQVLCNINRVYGDFIFVFDPLKTDLTEEDYMTFKRPDAVIEAKILDHALLIS